MVNPSTSLVALDVDGTLIHYDQSMSPRVRKAVRAAYDAGHQLVIATGRSLLGTLPIADELGLDDNYLVCSNGAVTIRLDPNLPEGYEIADMVTFDPGPVVALVREQLPDALFAVEVVGQGARVSGDWPEGELSGLLDVVPFDRLIDGPTTRVVVRSPGRTPADFLEMIERIGLHGVSYAVGYTAWLDLAPEGVSKASALEKVREWLGVPLASTIAIGDGRNDLEMLAWAARGIAMGNASDIVLAAADEIAADVRDDGAAQVLEELLAQASDRER